MNLSCYTMRFVILLMLGCFNRYTHAVKVSYVERIVTREIDAKCKNTSEKIVVNNYQKTLSSNICNFINNNNSRKYNYANKGIYSSYCYTVKPGDTLFYIAWITGNNYYNLAKRNNINAHDILKVGQILLVGCDSTVFRSKFLNSNNIQNSNISKKISNCSDQKRAKFKFKDTLINGTDGFGKKVCSASNEHFLNSLPMFEKDISGRCNSHRANLNSAIISSPIPIVEKKSLITWGWPIVHGRIINQFSLSEGGNKGIDISGVLGQPVFSAAQGKVVYAGDALLGYGNLIIIKHSGDFLSTYAHNEKILVVEHQIVTIGQQIATMGSSGSDMVKLHFEIRHKGKSVDPLYYLPKQTK